MSVKFRNVLLAVAATVVSLTAGCSEAGTPVSPRATAPAALAASKVGTSSTSSTSLTAPTGSIDVLARFRQKPQITIAWAKAWIGPGGGRIDFVGFTLIVPAGAVDKVTMFSIRLPVDPNGSEHVVAEFGPHNTSFAKPLTIGFPYRGTTIEGDPGAAVVWWNGGWVNMGGTVSADGSQILTSTTHFSEFGTAAYRGGTLTTAGG
jgi:hypothetical protein